MSTGPTPDQLICTFDVQNVIGYASYDGKSQVVTQFMWHYSGSWADVEGKIWTANEYGLSKLNPDEIVNFVPYDQLTKEKFYEWALLTGFNPDSCKNNFVNTINAEMAPKPPVVGPLPPLPWE
jgi:hypothetical protein